MSDYRSPALRSLFKSAIHAEPENATWLDTTTSRKLNRALVRCQRDLDEAISDHRISKAKVGIALVGATTLVSWMIFVLALTLTTLDEVDYGDLMGMTWIIGTMLGFGISFALSFAFESWGSTCRKVRRARYDYEDATLDAAGM